MLENLLLPFAFFLGTVLVLFALWHFLVSHLRFKGGMERTVDLALFSVILPKEENQEGGEDKKEEKEIIGSMEQLLDGFSHQRDSFWREKFLGAPQISLEIANPFNSEKISFYFAVPRRYSTTAEKQIYGIFPNALVEQVPHDFNVFTPAGAVRTAYATQAKTNYLPLKTYKTLNKDPLNPIANALSNLKKEDEGAALQLIIRPIYSGWKGRANLIVRRMKQGESFFEARGGEFFRFLNQFFKSQHKKELNKYGSIKETLRELTPGEEEILKLVEEKAAKNVFEVNLRLIASAETEPRAEEIMYNLIGAFSQFNTIEMNSLVFKKPRRFSETIFNFSFRHFVSGSRMILGTEEISSMFHFPTCFTQAPKIATLGAKTASAPPDLPQEGLLLGINNYRGAETFIHLGREDRRRHFYSVGQTGTGKSSFLENLIIQDLEEGEGLCIIDPHGELIEKVLDFIPASRLEDVVLFDPSDVERPLGLNLLEYNRPEDKTFVINEMINIFDKLYDLKQTGGPMFEQYMRNAMLLVMAHPESGSTLLEISKVLSDPDFRRFKLEHCDNQVVVDFWVKEAEKAGGEAALVNMVPYITSKLTPFITNDIMRPIIAQQKTSLNFRAAMDEKKIMLVNLSKGRIGEMNANLLGMVIVGKILMAAMSRVDTPEPERKDFYLYIDEFQNFTTDSIVSILSEARKYRLSLIIAHQFIAQLEENIRDAVFGNAGSLVSFRVGPEDAEFLEKQYLPVFSRQDLINVDNFKAFARIMANGLVSKPFSLATIPPKKEGYGLTAKIKELSRLRYGRDRILIEQEIKERMKLSEAAGVAEKEAAASADPIDSDMPVK